jgi:hypothetical protein
MSTRVCSPPRFLAKNEPAPSVAMDVGKQALSGLAEVPEYAAGFVPTVLNYLGRGAEALRIESRRIS